MVSIDEVYTFCKRKGFVFPSSEIYGGISGIFDYGPLGVELKNNIKKMWWRYVVQNREDVVGLEGSIITHPKVWEASGHVDSFIDVAVVCKKCGFKSKVDKHEIKKVICEKCGGDYENKGEFNPMFVTHVGITEEDSIKTYLRPETAQIIFTNFKNVVDTSRVKLPFGIAQMGKSFRNEVSPRNFLFRMREFEHLELEFFVHPKKLDDCVDFDEIKDLNMCVLVSGNKKEKSMKISDLYPNIIKSKWLAFWVGYRYKWYTDIGINSKKLRVRQHDKDELSHYSSDTWDIEYNYDFGWRELEGIADRTSFDLKQHMEHSKKDLRYFDENTKEKVLPNVAAEPSVSVDRVFLTVLMDSYNEEDVDGEKRIVLKLHPKLAPYKVAILPLVKKDGIAEKAREVYDSIKNDFHTFYDESGSIGRRYRRMDEVGTPKCITIDYDTMKDNTVTIRDRDTMEQQRIRVDEIKDYVGDLL